MRIMKTRNKAGFTILELMIVVTIIGILAGVAAIKYGELLRKADEGAVHGNLGTLRSAISIYYADMEGQYPATPSVLTVSSKYLRAIPSVKIPGYHQASAQMTLSVTADDAAGWVYNATTSNSKFGTISVNCVHTDSKGSIWSAY